MKVAYFDCFWGISGDMILASLADAGLDFRDFLNQLRKFKFDFFSISRRKIKRAGISATQISICSKKKKNYSYLEFRKVLECSKLPEAIKKRCLLTFRDLAWAEKKVHGIKGKDFHFEQLGEVDTLADIAGTYIALDLLGIKKVYFSKIRLARGGKFRHDTKALPLPGPAVLELLKGIPVEFVEQPFEYVTPTGAVLVKNLLQGNTNKLPPFKLLSIGYGAGSKVFASCPNVLRIIIGETTKISSVT